MCPEDLVMGFAFGREVVIVFDFGFTRSTRSGDGAGDFKYRAPEQIMRRSDIGPEADLYALGAVLYEMLAGRPPFEAPLLGMGPLENLVQRLLDPVPSERVGNAEQVKLELDAIASRLKPPSPRRSDPAEAKPSRSAERAAVQVEQRFLWPRSAGVTAGLFFMLGVLWALIGMYVVNHVTHSPIQIEIAHRAPPPAAK
jgi:serine/threonine protein kinase